MYASVDHTRAVGEPAYEGVHRHLLNANTLNLFGTLQTYWRSYIRHRVSKRNSSFLWNHWRKCLNKFHIYLPNIVQRPSSPRPIAFTSHLHVRRMQIKTNIYYLTFRNVWNFCYLAFIHSTEPLALAHLSICSYHGIHCFSNYDLWTASS